jgi:hypothetical protein
VRVWVKIRVRVRVRVRVKGYHYDCFVCLLQELHPDVPSLFADVLSILGEKFEIMFCLIYQTMKLSSIELLIRVCVCVCVQMWKLFVQTIKCTEIDFLLSFTQAWLVALNFYCCIALHLAFLFVLQHCAYLHVGFSVGWLVQGAAGSGHIGSSRIHAVKTELSNEIRQN